MSVGRTARRILALVRRICLIALAIALLAATLLSGLIYHEISSDLPSIGNAAEYQPPVTTQIMADDGTMIGEFYEQRRYVVPLDRIPSHVRSAFVAAEDEAFYRHPGIDVAGILRAALHNLRDDGTLQGGSTITQQVVKSVLLTPRRSYARKLREMILSLRLEHALSKNEILLLYLNSIYLGSGAYGVAAAADEYFGKDIADVDLAEAAVLAGLAPAPTRYSPFRNWPAAKARQRYVLNRMYEAGFITQMERDAAIEEPISLAAHKDGTQPAPYFVAYVRRTLTARYGRTALYQLGLRVHTTLDLRLQAAAEHALRGGIDALAERMGGFRSAFRTMDPEQRHAYLRGQTRRYAGVQRLDPALTYEALVTAVRRNTARVQVGPFAGDLMLNSNDRTPSPTLSLHDVIQVRVVDDDPPLRFAYDPNPPIEGAIIAVDPHSGFIKAMVGGYDFDRSQFNRVTQARRQPGSAFKPLVYAAALDRNFSLSSVIIDAPVAYRDHNAIWAPQNYEKRFFGPTSLRTALVKSRNVVTVKLAERIGLNYLIDYLPRFGLCGPIAHNLSIALGTQEVTLLEMAYAYCMFANAGRRPRPLAITEITDQRGQVLERRKPALAPEIPAATALQITSALQDVVAHGTGIRAAGLGQPTAGKTGTTNGFADAWFIGYTPQLLAAVWIGFDDRRPIGPKQTGGKIAAPIWKSFMSEALRDEPPAEFAVPEGVNCANLDPQTGERGLPGAASHVACFPSAGAPPASLASSASLRANDGGSGEPSSLDFLRSDF